MGKLYKVGEYGEMKLGEFRKNIMQYTRNNLRSIIASSDPEIVEIAIDELTRNVLARRLLPKTISVFILTYASEWNLLRHLSLQYMTHSHHLTIVRSSQSPTCMNHVQLDLREH